MAISGKTGYVTYKLTTGGTVVTLCADNWKIDDTADALDTTNFCTGGMQDNTDGIRRGSYTISGPVLAATTIPAVGAVVTIEVGSGTSPIVWATDYLLVSKSNKKLGVADSYRFEISGKTTTVDDA
jgi:hypothetical protein